MDNLHRELAPISAAAWADLEEEARRTFRRHVAGRRIIDVAGPGGPQLAAVGTGHLQAVEPPADGVLAHIRRSQPIVELQVPLTIDRQQVDDVERGARDADWQPVKISSPFGPTVVMITNGHRPYPFGREVTGYAVAHLDATLAKARTAGAVVLWGPRAVTDRDSGILRFPGGYLAEIHETNSR